jgi:parallel beta-helix repeat protein
MVLRRLSILALALALALVVAPAAFAKTITVRPGQSIQAAVNQANPGDTVKVKPGTYTEPGTPCVLRPGRTCAVVITDDNIKLIGDGGHRRVTLRNPGGQGWGISVGENRDGQCAGTVGDSVQRSLVQGFTIKDFDNDGVLLRCVDHWRVTDVWAINNQSYGTFPSHVGPGRLDHSFASGANDTGHYVGQSHDVRMDHNFATDNVSGFEIENSVRVVADHNIAVGNTGGILSFALPFLDVPVNEDVVIKYNVVINNNRPNTCQDPSDAVCGVLQGTGILLLAADKNDVFGNLVLGNDTFGIAVANFCTGTNTPPEICGLLDIEPNPDNNRITFNIVKGNGNNPDPRTASPNFANDLVWDTSGTGNCWSHNWFGTSFPDPLPSC